MGKFFIIVDIFWFWVFFIYNNIMNFLGFKCILVMFVVGSGRIILYLSIWFVCIVCYLFIYLINLIVLELYIIIYK